MKLKEAVEAYAAEHLALGYKSKAWKYFAKEALAFFGEDKPMTEAMAAASVAQYLGHCRGNDNSPQTLTNKLCFLKKLCLLSTEAGTLVVFPRRVADSIVVDNARERVLDEREKKRLQEAMPHDDDWQVVANVFRTGLRSKEFIMLRVADCHFGRGEALIRGENTRTGKARVIPMVGEFRAYCAAAAKARREYVFKFRAFEHYKSRLSAGLNWKDKVLRVAVLRAGIKDWSIHDGRHQATTELLEAGGDPMDITKIMGWKSGTYISRYGNIRMNKLKATMALIDKPTKSRRRAVTPQ